MSNGRTRLSGSCRASRCSADGAVAQIAKEFLQAVRAEAGFQLAFVHVDLHRHGFAGGKLGVETFGDFHGRANLLVRDFLGVIRDLRERSALPLADRVPPSRSANPGRPGSSLWDFFHGLADELDQRPRPSQS
jgi:hypothetical protein